MKKKIVIGVILGIIVIILGVLVKMNFFTPIKVSDVTVKKIKIDKSGFEVMKKEIQSQNEKYKDKLPSEDMDDYYSISIFATVKNNSFFDLTGFYGQANNIKNDEVICAQTLEHAWYDNIDSKESMDKQMIVNVSIYKNGLSDEEIVKKLKEIKLDLHYSNTFFNELTMTIDLGDYITSNQID